MPSRKPRTPRKPPKRPWSAPRLNVSGGLRFVFRKEVRLPSDPGPSVEATAQAVLTEAGFEPVRLPRSPKDAGNSLPTDPEAWVGERWLPRRRGTASTTRTPILTLFVGAGLLGGLDAYIANSPVILGYWLLGAAVVALVFWARYGRTYDTDVAMVSVSRTAPNTTPGSGSTAVVFGASRVRSQVHSGIRVPTGVSGPIWLAAELGDLAQEFEQRVAAAGGAPAPKTVPP